MTSTRPRGLRAAGSATGGGAGLAGGPPPPQPLGLGTPGARRSLQSGATPIHYPAAPAPNFAAIIRHVTCDQSDLGPTEPDTGRGWFLLTSGFTGSGSHRAARGAGLIPNETQFPRRALAACLTGTRRRIRIGIGTIENGLN